VTNDGSDEAPRWDGKRRLLVALLAAPALAGAALCGWHHARPPRHCAEGMVALGARCCGEGQSLDAAGRCAGTPRRCAHGMEVTAAGCVAASGRVALAGGLLRIAPVDWEAPRLVAPREARVEPFALDRHEVTESEWLACVAAGGCPPLALRGEAGLPVTGMTAAEAGAYCAWRQGRLPTLDELTLAAAGTSGRRYPWGETGLVCRRVAFGLHDGPCATDARGPTLAGSHPEGASPEGVYDLAGNVAEWTAPVGATAAVLGGSWRDREASALRPSGHAVVAEDARSDAVGLRCAYHSP
jgi:formylglycine-generating enzyme required for sulfatase activity